MPCKSRNPESLLKSFKSEDKVLTLGARISGPVKSAFETVPEGMDETAFVKETEDVQILVVADTDVLTDQFWVQRQQFFGQQVLQAFANNGDMLSNMVENLGGSSTLIGVRARGKYTRPFDVVDELKVQAEARYRDGRTVVANQAQRAGTTAQRIADAKRRGWCIGAQCRAGKSR